MRSTDRTARADVCAHFQRPCGARHPGRRGRLVEQPLHCVRLLVGRAGRAVHRCRDLSTRACDARMLAPSAPQLTIASASRASRIAGADRATPARASTIHITCTRPISICSGPATCSSCCRLRARAWARTHSPAGCCRPLPIATVLERQQCVAELRERLDLREDLAVLGETAGVGVQPEELVRWAESPNRLRAGWVLPVALLLPVLLIAALVFWNVRPRLAGSSACSLLEFGVVRLLRTSPRRGARQHRAGIRQSQAARRTDGAAGARAGSTPRSSKRLLQQLSSRGHSRIARDRAARQRSCSSSNRDATSSSQLLDLPLLYSVHAALAAERWRRRSRPRGARAGWIRSASSKR